jgi:hypothetical protein
MIYISVLRISQAHITALDAIVRGSACICHESVSFTPGVAL